MRTRQYRVGLNEAERAELVLLINRATPPPGRSVGPICRSPPPRMRSTPMWLRCDQRLLDRLEAQKNQGLNHRERGRRRQCPIIERHRRVGRERV